MREERNGGREGGRGRGEDMSVAFDIGTARRKKGKEEALL